MRATAVAAHLLVQAAQAETMTARKTLEALFAAEPVSAERFAPGFLAQVPAAQVAQIVDRLRRDHGRLVGVEPAGQGFTVHLAEADIPAQIGLDGDGRIAALWFGPARATGSLDAQVAAIGALPGRTALLATTDGKVVAARDAGVALAVGSAAKLAVLLAVSRAVTQGRLAWDTVVPLDPHWKSLPSGQLQDWPDGTPVTVATLAHLMVSVSDNTATDALIRLVGREAVEAITPGNAPFPTTRELFTLKTRENAPLRAEWRSGDAGRRRAILARIADAPLPGPEALDPAPTHDVAWFMTAEALCGLLDAAADLPSLGINPGPLGRDGWRSVAYKGGSEVGVLNLSSRFTDRDGRVHCVVATWNADGPLDAARLLTPYLGLAGQLATRRD